MSDEPLLKVNDLHAGYGDVGVLWGVDLEVRQDEIVCLLGSNGAGKTTLMRTLSSLVRPSAGSIRFDGRELSTSDPDQVLQAGVAHVPEGRRLFSGMSVRDNLLLGAVARRAAREVVARDLDRALDHFPALRERLDRPAGGLSGGQQQMLAVARGLMGAPRFLMLDEPSLGLAPILVREIFAVIARLRTDGVTILLVEQMAGQALGLADRAYVLERGRVTLSGPAAEIRENPAVVQAYLGSGRR